jgi:hypothetical protein
MPEIMRGVEVIAAKHLANVISISDGNGESTYSAGAEEITAQSPEELAAAAAGIPVLVERAIQFTPDHIGEGGMTYLLAGGFLPGHPVQMSIDGKAVATLTVGDLGTVTCMIDPSLLKLRPGEHTIQLNSLLLNKTGRFHIS